MEPAKLIDGAVRDLAKEERALAEREWRIRRAEQKLKKQYRAVEEKSSEATEQQRATEAAVAALEAKRTELIEAMNSAVVTRASHFAQQQAHQQTVLGVQAQMQGVLAMMTSARAPAPAPAPAPGMGPRAGAGRGIDFAARLRLNVGGQTFEVSQHVLLRDPTSLLAATCACHNEAAGTPFPSCGEEVDAAAMGGADMLALTAALAATSLRHRVPESGPGDAYFFDRDWVMFRHVLAFLRDGRLPSRASLMRQLYQEALFFDLHSLQAELEEEVARRFFALSAANPAHAHTRPGVADVERLLGKVAGVGGERGGGENEHASQSRGDGEPRRPSGRPSTPERLQSAQQRARRWLLAGGQAARRRGSRASAPAQQAVGHLARTWDSARPLGATGTTAAGPGEPAGPAWAIRPDDVLGPKYETARRAAERYHAAASGSAAVAAEGARPSSTLPRPEARPAHPARRGRDKQRSRRHRRRGRSSSRSSSSSSSSRSSSASSASSTSSFSSRSRSRSRSSASSASAHRRESRSRPRRTGRGSAHSSRRSARTTTDRRRGGRSRDSRRHGSGTASGSSARRPAGRRRASPYSSPSPRHGSGRSQRRARLAADDRAVGARRRPAGGRADLLASSIDDEALERATREAGRLYASLKRTVASALSDEERAAAPGTRTRDAERRALEQERDDDMLQSTGLVPASEARRSREVAASTISPWNDASYESGSARQRRGGYRGERDGRAPTQRSQGTRGASPKPSGPASRRGRPGSAVRNGRPGRPGSAQRSRASSGRPVAGSTTARKRI